MAITDIEKIKRIAQDSHLYVPMGTSEPIKISWINAYEFSGVGDNSGEFAVIQYKDVDLNNDVFYKCVKVDVNDY